MAVKDQEKTTFITPFGAFCYVSMPFGLKSAKRLTSDAYRIVFINRSGAMFMLTWMISWLNPSRRKL